MIMWVKKKKPSAPSPSHQHFYRCYAYPQNGWFTNLHSSGTWDPHQEGPGMRQSCGAHRYGVLFQFQEVSTRSQVAMGGDPRRNSRRCGTFFWPIYRWFMMFNHVYPVKTCVSFFSIAALNNQRVSIGGTVYESFLKWWIPKSPIDFNTKMV